MLSTERWWCSSGETGLPPPFRHVQDLAPPEQRCVEERREAMLVEASTGAILRDALKGIEQPP